MSDISNEIKEVLKAIVGAWTSYLALGSFFLYLTGYLSLRFHLTALGIGTDIALIDERYLYAGAKFWVYIFTLIPIIFLFIFGLILLLAVALLPPIIARYVFRKFFKRVANNQKIKLNIIRRLSSNPNLVAILGIILSVLVIQTVMRQCFYLVNLLLNPTCDNSWVEIVLKNSFYEVIFFSGIVASTVITGGLLFYAWEKYKKISARNVKIRTIDFRTRLLLCVLLILFAIQFLLLPVNHGILIADKSFPKVKDLGGAETLAEGQNAWLVWEGGETFTYFVETPVKDAASGEINIQRKLVTLSKKEIKRTEIIGYDKLLGRARECKK